MQQTYHPGPVTPSTAVGAPGKSLTTFCYGQNFPEMEKASKIEFGILLSISFLILMTLVLPCYPVSGFLELSVVKFKLLEVG